MATSFTIKSYILYYRVDINCANATTGMTPCHCAAIQGHGRVLMTLLEHAPNLAAKDSQGRLAHSYPLCALLEYFVCIEFHSQCYNSIASKHI